MDSRGSEGLTSNDVSYASGTAEGTGADFSDEELRQEFLQRRRELRDMRRVAEKEKANPWPAEQPGLAKGGITPQAFPPDGPSQYVMEREPCPQELETKEGPDGSSPGITSSQQAAGSLVESRPTLEAAEGCRMMSAFDISRAGTMFSDVIPIDTPLARASHTGQFSVTPNPFEIEMPVLLVQGERQGRPILIESVFASAVAGMAMFASHLPSSIPSSMGSANGMLELMNRFQQVVPPTNVVEAPPAGDEPRGWDEPPDEEGQSSPRSSGASSSADRSRGRPRQQRKWVGCRHPLHCLSPPAPAPRPNSVSRIIGRPPFTIPKCNHRSSSVSNRNAVDLNDERYFVSKTPERSIGSPPPKPLYSLRHPTRPVALFPHTPPRPRRAPSEPTPTARDTPPMDYLTKAHHNMLQATYGPKVMDIIMKHCEKDDELALSHLTVSG